MIELKVYDCFTFYNEFELLELRLKSLWDMVDYFVLVEADKTQSNKTKPFYFAERQDDFKKFSSKIRHIPLKMTVDYKGTGDWQIEHGQRNAIMYGLEDAEPDDLIFISDLDEIPAPNILQRIKNNQAPLIIQCKVPSPIKNQALAVNCQLLVPTSEFLEYSAITLAQQHHHYYLDAVKKFLWKGTVLLKRENLSTPQKFRDMRFGFPYISNAGWHFSYMGGLDRVIKKSLATVEGYERVEDGRMSVAREHVEKCMKYGVYLDDNVDDFENIPISRKSFAYDISKINLPYLKKFVEKYPYFLRKYDFTEELNFLGGRNNDE